MHYVTTGKVASMVFHVFSLRKKTGILFEETAALQVSWIKPGTTGVECKQMDYHKPLSAYKGLCRCRATVLKRLRLNRASKKKIHAIWMLLKPVWFLLAYALPKVIRQLESDPAGLRCADVFTLTLASVYAHTLYVWWRKIHTQRTSDGFYGAVSARALSSVIVL